MDLYPRGFEPHFWYNGSCFMTSLVAQTVKRLRTMPTMWETRVQSLGREDLLEKEMATHSTTLVWKIPWTVEPGRLQSMGSQRVRHDWATSPVIRNYYGFDFFLFFSFFYHAPANTFIPRLNWISYSQHSIFIFWLWWRNGLYNKRKRKWSGKIKEEIQYEVRLK